MKALFKLIATICLFLSALFCSACKNSYDSMISDFNEKHFTPEPPRLPDYSINGADFEASEMLELSYIFPVGMFVNLEAPEGGTSYSWKCINMDGSETEISTSRVLYYETPGVFKDGEENKLLLTVTASRGNENTVEYTDNAIVILKQTQNKSVNMCSLSIGLNSSSSARTINPESFTQNSPELTHFVLKGTSITTGAELNDGAGIDLTSSFTGNPPVASYDIPYGAWELTLEAGNGTEVLLKGRQFADLRKSKDTIKFVLSTANVDKNGSVLLGGTYEDKGNVAKFYEAGLYSLDGGVKKYSLDVTIDSTSAPTYSFSFEELTDVTPGRYSFIMKFYDSDDAENRKQVGYWEDIVVVAAGRQTKDENITCGKIISQKPDAPKDLKAYMVLDSEVDNENGQFFTVRFKWTDSSINEESFVLTVTECKGKNNTEIKEGGQSLVFMAEDGIIDLGAGSQQCDVLLPREGYFIASIQSKNYLGLSDPCNYKSDNAAHNSDGTKGFGGKSIGYKE